MRVDCPVMLRVTSCTTLSLVFGLCVLTGCNRDVRLAGHHLRDAKVGTVAHYGVTLDENATPQQVAYVLLRAVRDDFLARTPEDREKALDVQFDLCAANEIETRNRTAMSRTEYLYNVVYRWTPTVSHYVHDFETEWEEADKRFILHTPLSNANSTSKAKECSVLMGLNDPGGDPNARVVMVVWLVRDKGFWRVLHLGFDPTRRTLEGRAVTSATGS